MKQQEDAAQEQTDEIESLLDEVCQALMDGATYKDIHGIPQNTMDGVYAYAYKFYQQGKLKEAETFSAFSVSMIFITLTMSWGWQPYIS